MEVGRRHGHGLAWLRLIDFLPNLGSWRRLDEHMLQLHSSQEAAVQGPRPVNLLAQSMYHRIIMIDVQQQTYREGLPSSGDYTTRTVQTLKSYYDFSCRLI